MMCISLCIKYASHNVIMMCIYGPFFSIMINQNHTYKIHTDISTSVPM